MSDVQGLRLRASDLLPGVIPIVSTFQDSQVDPNVVFLPRREVFSLPLLSYFSPTRERTLVPWPNGIVSRRVT